MVKTYLECECVFVLGVPNITDLLVGTVNSNFVVAWGFDDGGCSVTAFNLSFTEEGMDSATFSSNITEIVEDRVYVTIEDRLQRKMSYTVTVTGVNAVGVSEEAVFFYFPGMYMYVGSADPFIPYISVNYTYIHTQLAVDSDL